MHEQHADFQALNPDLPIWRYMDLAKLLSMLKDRSLYFVRASKLEDNFEGSVSQATIAQRRNDILMGDEVTEQYLRSEENFALYRKRFIDYAYISCWHMNEDESVAMWKQYQSGESRGIAVRSTYRRLSESITDERQILIGPVSYINYEVDVLSNPWNMLSPIVHKRKSFEYEREIRAIHIGERYFSDKNKPEVLYWAPLLPGIDVSVDLDRLVEEVYVSPKAEPWFKEVVENVLRRYERDWGEVRHSSLDRNPIY